MNDNVVSFPTPEQEPVVTIDDIFSDLKNLNATQVVVFSLNGTGEVMIHGTHGYEETDDLIDDGLTEWLKMCEYEDDEEEEDYDEE